MFNIRSLHLLKKIILLIVVSHFNIFTYSQNAVAGEYYLLGAGPEVASGFLLKPDSTFQFFFSYGALDREGEGKYSIHNNKVFFNSRPKPATEFELIKNKIVSNDSTVIKIVDKNTVLLRYVYALLKFADTTIEENANEEGEIIIARKWVESISLKLGFCPEKNSVFKAGQSENYFEFKMKPTIMEVFFENFQLSIDKKSLLGKHPLLDDKEYSYEKE